MGRGVSVGIVRKNIGIVRNSAAVINARALPSWNRQPRISTVTLRCTRAWRLSAPGAVADGTAEGHRGVGGVTRRGVVVVGSELDRMSGRTIRACRRMRRR